MPADAQLTREACENHASLICVVVVVVVIDRNFEEAEVALARSPLLAMELPPWLRAELAAQLRLGIPVAVGSVLRRSMVVWTVAFVGRLGPAAMAASALAVSATNTFALSVMVGLSSASVTLVSQAVGAKDARQAGLWLHRALLVHALAAVPLTALLLCFGRLLRAMGEELELSDTAGRYAVVLVPGCLLYTSPSPRDRQKSRMPSSA